MPQRCAWANVSPHMTAYHDTEWGVPQHDDRVLYEFLVLEGAQAGLSWSTILNKRQGYRTAFHHFDVAAVAAYDEGEVERLLVDAAIVRNRLKVRSAIANARALQQVAAAHGSFDAFIWRFVGGQPIQHACRALAEVPASTSESDAMSRELRRLGFTFVGTTICYAYMQAVGMVNDHMTECYRYAAVAALGVGGDHMRTT
jgi:DNA-3-methyladenine glycosylase I